MDDVALVERIKTAGSEAERDRMLDELVASDDVERITLVAQALYKTYWLPLAQALIRAPASPNRMGYMISMLQDMSWPGSMPVYDHLRDTVGQPAVPQIMHQLEAARAGGDEMWADTLEALLIEIHDKG